MYKILIRPLVISDAETSWKWRNDSEIWKYTGSRPSIPITPEIEKEWIIKVLADPYSKRFAITVDNQYVGNIQLTNITASDAEYHIFIGDKNYWGKGVGYAATQQIIRYAKNNLKLKEIYLHVNPSNNAAVKLYENCGFKGGGDETKMTLILDSMKKAKVSVFCMVYNHEPFLKKCIDGFIMQKTDFDFEIVIGEDCSSDKSRDILLEYNKKYPGKFKLLLHESNVGAAKNQEEVFKACQGEYIAMCEGDDYWTDPLKLQKQVNFLEANPDYVLSFHQVEVLKPNGELVKDFITNVPENYETIETLARLGNYIHTPSVVFRNVILEFPPEFVMSPIGDYFLYMLLAEHGKLKYFEEEMAVYRFGVGIHSTHTQIKMAKANFKLFTLLLSYSKNPKINQILLERQLPSFDYTEYLIRSEYSEAFVSNRVFFKALKSLRQPAKFWGKVKNKFK
ncbi:MULTISPECIES: GNAT family N-acetyltransferase [Flavobacterium]|uniref:GNAT family N-acetyltransferase n=1 Tax=Flavobacterium TaxID=237 RepID=UPI001FCC0158|nr:MULTISPECIES: GNAT family N-acetyltransferase [Flavobacterium]UOK43780.1 GNAT family N-acetyltransferase [Flavobacterium enshiense]